MKGKIEKICIVNEWTKWISATFLNPVYTVNGASWFHHSFVTFRFRLHNAGSIGNPSRLDSFLFGGKLKEAWWRQVDEVKRKRSFQDALLDRGKKFFASRNRSSTIRLLKRLQNMTGKPWIPIWRNYRETSGQISPRTCKCWLGWCLAYALWCWGPSLKPRLQ